MEGIELGSFSIFRAISELPVFSSWNGLSNWLEGFWKFLLILKYHLVGVWEEIPLLNPVGEKSRLFTAPQLSSSLFRVTYCCDSLSTSFYYTGPGLVGSCDVCGGGGGMWRSCAEYIHFCSLASQVPMASLLLWKSGWGLQPLTGSDWQLKWPADFNANPISPALLVLLGYYFATVKPVWFTEWIYTSVMWQKLW